MTELYAAFALLILAGGAFWTIRGHCPIWDLLRWLCRASHFTLAACIVMSWAGRNAVRFVQEYWNEAQREATRVANAKPEPAEERAERVAEWREREA